MNAKQIAVAAGIAPRTKRFTLRDENGYAVDPSMARHLQVLCALNRSDVTPGIATRERIIAMALLKAINTGRIDVHLLRRIREQYTPYQLCALVATISDRFQGEPTIGALADTWINRNANSL